MKSLDDLARAIDLATDVGDETSLRRLCDECERHLNTAQGSDRVRLRYYQANTFSAIIAAKQLDKDYTWDWEQPDGVSNILLLRRAIAEPAFQQIDPIVSWQIRTNLGNRLTSLGRPIAANEQWSRVLAAEPLFAKALVNQALFLEDFAGNLYDYHHTSILLESARSLLEKALHKDAMWESDDRDEIMPTIVKKVDKISDYLIHVDFDEDFDLDQWSLGATNEERSYRRWCLRERLFLNPLNEACSCSVAATDVLHLPSHTYRFEESPRFPDYYNLLKQEYISARYQLYRAMYGEYPEFLTRDVLMLSGANDQALGYYTEDLKSALRSSYALFDKIGLFINDFFQIDLNPRQVTFRSIWSERASHKTFRLRSIFKDRKNWFLRGLYFLSKDLFDKNFKDVAEPDAASLARLRQQVEHRFLSLQHKQVGESTETHELIAIEDFQDRALRLLKMAREAMIYISLAMHREQAIRAESCQRQTRFVIPSKPLPIDSSKRGWS